MNETPDIRECRLEAGEKLVINGTRHGSVGLNYELDIENADIMDIRQECGWEYPEKMEGDTPLCGGDKAWVRTTLTAKAEGQCKVREIEDFRGVRRVVREWHIQVDGKRKEGCFWKKCGEM